MSFNLKDRWRLEGYVTRRLGRLQDDYLRDVPSAKALLSRLRREATKDPGEVSETWDFEFGGLPESLLGKGSQPPTEGEWAAHLAMTLYAVHQQSRSEGMCIVAQSEGEGRRGLGYAVKRFAISKGENVGEALEPGEMPRRFSALVTADSIGEVAHYARQLVQQLRDAGIPLDYGLLAGQLYAFQFRSLRKRVSLEWAREFNRWVAPSDEIEEG